MNRRIRILVWIMLCMLLAGLATGCDALISSAKPMTADTTALPKTPWSIPTEVDLLTELTESMTQITGFRPDELALALTASHAISTPDYEQAADYAARNYVATASFAVYLPDITMDAAVYKLPEYSGVIRDAPAYLDEAITRYDELMAGLVGASTGDPVVVCEMRVRLERVNEREYRLSFDESDVRALVGSMIDMLHTPFRNLVDASEDYQRARAAAVLCEIYPTAYALIKSRESDSAAIWFRPDRLIDYLAHMRILRCRRVTYENHEIYSLTAMLPLVDDFLLKSGEVTLQTLDTMDHAGRVPAISDAFFETAIALESDALAYSGIPYEIEIERRRLPNPERDDPVEWGEGSEPIMHASCRLSPELEETLLAVMAGARAWCEEITPAIRTARYAEWNHPKTQMLDQAKAAKMAPLIIQTHGIQGYYVVLERLDDPQRKPITAFVRGGETLTTAVPLGTYAVTYIVGEGWQDLPEGFGSQGRVIVPEHMRALHCNDAESGYRIRLYGETVGEESDEYVEE